MAAGLAVVYPTVEGEELLVQTLGRQWGWLLGPALERTLEAAAHQTMPHLLWALSLAQSLARQSAWPSGHPRDSQMVQALGRTSGSMRVAASDGRSGRSWARALESELVSPLSAALSAPGSVPGSVPRTAAVWVQVSWA